MPEQDRLDKAGEKFHIEVEEIYSKGHGEEPGGSAEDRKGYLFRVHAEAPFLFLTTRSRPGAPRSTDRAAPRASRCAYRH